MLHILDHRARLLALEAYSTHNVVELVKSVATDIYDAFGDFAAQFDPRRPALHLTSKQTAFLREVPKHNYVDIRPLGCFVPAGLNVPYLKYIDVLSPAVRSCAEMPEAVLAPYAQFLANLVTNRDAASGAGINAKLVEAKKAREIHNRSIGACFLEGSNRTDRSLGQVVARNTDWQPVLKGADEMIQAINKVDRNALDKKMRECVELLGLIQKKLKKGDFKDMSPASATSLADGAHEVALELEFFSVTYYRVQALATALNQTVERLDEIFKK